MIKDRAQIVQELYNQSNQLNSKNSLYKQWIFRYTFLELEKDLQENGDITTDSIIHEPKKVTARIYANEGGILAGGDEINYFLMESDSAFKPQIKNLEITQRLRDGDFFAKDDMIMEIVGDIKDILKVERIVLNLISHMSSIATKTSRIIEIANKANPNVCIVPTRKTTWGLLDKRATFLGGGGTHRLNLSDAILIKDNHLAFFENSPVKLFENFIPPKKPYKFFEIEIDDPDQVIETAKLLVKLQTAKKIPSPAIMMFDNIVPLKIEQLLRKLREEALYDNLIFEASGGINENNIERYAKTGIDIISMGSLTQKIEPIDISLEIGM
ncbi:carboxylating nicotinate-nucleotide diphosphorylase [Patescibacteria group bacterium]|nr:carboxylating nicotinate-nucleotide diphosphorylase [Patescibacteria group bacterium]